jgi:hypothetical protein
VSYASGPMLGKTVELLISNVFICNQTYPDSFEYLNNQECRDKANDWLAVVGRSTCSTSDYRVFWAGYQDVDDADSQRAIRQQFSDVINNLEVIVRWMELASSNSEDGKHISPGQLISEPDLLKRIVSGPSQLRRLKTIARSRYINVSTDDTAKMLKNIIAKLTEAGYFVTENKSSMKHRATGKWAWLYSTMKFIAAHEGLLDDSDQLTDNQETLFSE